MSFASGLIASLHKRCRVAESEVEHLNAVIREKDEELKGLRELFDGSSGDLLRDLELLREECRRLKGVVENREHQLGMRVKNGK